MLQWMLSFCTLYGDLLFCSPTSSFLQQLIIGHLIMMENLSRVPRVHNPALDGDLKVGKNSCTISCSDLLFRSRLEFHSSLPNHASYFSTFPIHFTRFPDEDKINSVKLCHNKHFRGITVSKKKKKKKIRPATNDYFDNPQIISQINRLVGLKGPFLFAVFIIFF